MLVMIGLFLGEKKLPLEILTEILNGGLDSAKEAGIPILGGHTVRDAEPKYGLVVTGIIEEEMN